MAQEGGAGQEKTEAPTTRRLREARQKGDVVKSQEVPAAAVLLAGLLTLYLLADFLMQRLLLTLRYYLGNAQTFKIIPENMPGLTREAMLHFVILVGPLMVILMVVALVANYAQVGVVFSMEKITPQLAKINPLEGIKRLFSIQTLAQTVKSIAKLVIVGYVAVREVYTVLPVIPTLADQEVYAIMAFAGRVAFRIFLKAALIIALLAAADYIFQRWQFMKKMKMTKQELREEAKQTEGDPMIKGRIRSIQFAMARRRMMAEVPKAEVIITNPVRLAVALRYDPAEMAAPTVVAKGAGFLAQRIKEIAREHSIPIVEDKPLARAMYKSVKLGGMIPDNLFQAVAEVLAYVYSLKKRPAA